MNNNQTCSERNYELLQQAAEAGANVLSPDYVEGRKIKILQQRIITIVNTGGTILPRVGHGHGRKFRTPIFEGGGDDDDAE